MRIRELNLIRYGKFTDRHLSLPGAAQDIHLIVGPNEAGKSTVRNAIADWLFGIPVRTSLAFLHPMPTLRIGGVIEATAPAGVASDAGPATAGQLAFERTKAQKNTLRTPDDAVLPADALLPWLGTLQADAFNRMYALDHTMLIEGGAGILSASDDIGRMLFQSAAGIEHLGEALAALEKEAETLWSARRAGNRLYYQAHDAYTAAKADVTRLQLKSKDWKQLHEALEATDEALAVARRRHEEIRERQSRLERVRRIQPLLAAHDLAQTRFEALLADGMPALLDVQAPEVFRRASEQSVLIDAHIERLRTKIREHQQALAGIALDPEALRRAADIRQLNEQRLRFRDHGPNLLKRQEEVRALSGQLHGLVRELGWQDREAAQIRQRLPLAPVRTQLQQLIRERTNVQQDLQRAQAELDGARQTLMQIEAQLQTLGEASVDAALQAALEAARRLGDHEAEMAELQRRVDALALEIGRAQAAQGEWRQRPEDLQRMLVPEPAQVQQWLEQQRDDATEQRNQQEVWRNRQQQIEQQAQMLQQLVRDWQPVSREQVQEARRSRDDSWRQIRDGAMAAGAGRDAHTGLDAARALVFEQQIQQADALADARQERAQHEADRQARTDSLALLRLEQQGTERRLEAVQQRMEARARDWQQLAERCGLPQLPLDAAPVWLRQRERVLDLIGQQQALQQQHRQRDTLADERHRQLWQALRAAEYRRPVAEGAEKEASTETHGAAALTGAGERDEPVEAIEATEAVEEGTMPSLAECLHRANALISAAEQARGQRDTLQQQLQQLRQKCQAQEAGVRMAEQAWQRWTASWAATLAQIAYPADSSVEQLETQLALFAEVERLLDRIEHIQREEIDSRQTDLDALGAEARALAEALEPGLSSKGADEIGTALDARLRAASRAQDEHDGRSKLLQADRQELTQAEQARLGVEAELAPLLRAAGVQTLDALGPAIERSEQRRAVEQQRCQTERELLANADGLPIEVLRQQAQAMHPDALKAELESLQTDSAGIVEEISRLSRIQGQQKTDFSALDGRDEAARAAARQQEAVATMADAAERYLRLQTAARLLHWSIARFRETRQGPMLAKASTIFRTLTLEAFSHLLIDATDASPRLLGVRKGGEAVEVGGMSEGTRDQLYLALRLAALDLQIEQGQRMPLIADDLFINFDDQRTAAGLQVLGELSRRTQIICLTHHAHLVPLARSVLGGGLNVIEL